MGDRQSRRGGGEAEAMRAKAGWLAGCGWSKKLPAQYQHTTHLPACAAQQAAARLCQYHHPARSCCQPWWQLQAERRSVRTKTAMAAAQWQHCQYRANLVHQMKTMCKPHLATRLQRHQHINACCSLTHLLLPQPPQHLRQCQDNTKPAHTRNLCSTY